MLRNLKYKWRRHKMGRELRHMAELDPGFSLNLTSSQMNVVWRGQEVAKLMPIELNQHSESSLAFIVGSGPSLKQADIQAISEHKSFGVNGSIVKFIEQGISPDYYVICDASFVRDRWDIACKVFELKPRCFFTYAVLNEICLIDPSVLTQLEISVYDNHFKAYGSKALTYPEIVEQATHDSDLVTHTGKIGFSLNPNKGVFTAHTVVYHALQIAYGLGFRQIGILGMDLGAPAGEARFYESEKNAAPSHMNRDYYDWILPSFMVVKSLCDQGIFSVYNLSRQSRLPETVVPKINLEQLCINAREN